MLTSTAPHVCPGLADVGTPLRRWNVTHACDFAAAVLPVAQAQLEAGIRATVLTPHTTGCPTQTRFWLGWEFSRPLQTFRDFRRWRRLLAAETAADIEILHAHCLGAGIAAALGEQAVVHDFRASLAPRSWLLRATENFTLRRAAAVVVHSQAMWAEALCRGVRAEDLFLVPDPVEPCGTQPALSLSKGALACAVPRAPAPATSSSVVLMAPNLASEAEVSMLLAAFAMLSAEIDGAHLLLEVEGELAHFAGRESERRELEHTVRLVAPADRFGALAAADLIIVGAPREENPGAAAISAFAHGRALLAADVPQNREVTPRGAGCIWYRAGDARDLANRAAFLARNPDFRAALAAGGRAHLAATRGPAVVARRYDEVYRHASHKRSGGSDDIISQLQAVQAWL